MIMARIRKKARDLLLGVVPQKEMVPVLAIQHPAGNSVCIGCGLEYCPHLDYCLGEDCQELNGHHTTY